MSRPAWTIGAIAIGLMQNAFVPALSVAQDWPIGPARRVALAGPSRRVPLGGPLAAGATADVIGRILSPHLSEILRQQVIIENIGGAGGMIGAHRVAKAADGYQFVLGSVSTHAHNQTLYKHPLYNAATDFVPVALIAEVPQVLIARKDLPPNTLQEFIAYTTAKQAIM